MQLIFSLAADGRVYPDAHDVSGDLDKDVVGTFGLVQTLETQLGMLAPSISKAVRISTYLAKLRSCGGDRFWASSFSKDPWSTATTILEWRDTLVGSGWRGKEIGSNRLDDLAAAEAVEPTLQAGLEDRAIALLDVLKTRPGLRIRQLGLADRRDLLPRLWARLIDALESVGVTILQHEQPELAPEGSDLRMVQRVLSGEPVQPLAGDGTFTMVEADTELMAAETTADWLAALPSEDLRGTVVFASNGDTALLDHALRARGIPALGLSASSSWRGALQVLPLAFAAAWQPFDPRVL